MSEVYHILDEQLPKNQDFKLLKEEGLEYIQDHMGNEWTNLNPGDPGVTILDQVCYALTELGYCNDFSVADILTHRDGKLYLRDQFYLPENILTASPVTIDDYRKYLIDGVAGVNNALVVPAEDTLFGGVYQVYLMIDPGMVSREEKEDVCMAAFFYLNKRRNLDEFFLMPLIFEDVSYLLSGSIEIGDGNELNKILTGIDNSIRDYIFPSVVPSGYAQLTAEGIETNEIFNGPLLQHGWIPDDALGQKKDQLHTFALIDLIKSIPGVKSVSGLSFLDQKGSSAEVSSQAQQLLKICAANSARIGLLEISCKGATYSVKSILQFGASAAKLPEAAESILFGAKVNVQTELPKGKFRDIENYYSIQNTFPEIFAVGTDATEFGAADFQIAQSRQLKGYLTLFDQVLANQFSQLANLDRLFSFKNSITDAFMDEGKRRHYPLIFDPKHHRYPVPYKAFSPTYFYQSLYDVPYIKPLLKDNDTFKFAVDFKSDKELEQKSWTRYKKDPYNPYIRGLMEFMEDEKNSLARRNNILDHLLARHGESPFMINSIIDGTLYTGDALKGQVIFKSLYLQNLGLLSYYRQKGYNYIGANKISAEIPKVTPELEQEILGGDTIDFVFRSGKIDKTERLKKQDFIDYSAIELKLSLLFGLKVQYRNYIAVNYDKPEKSENIRQALWMITQRCGVILVETGLLFQYGGEEISRYKEDETFNNAVHFIFPGSVDVVNTPEFKKRLELFLQNTLPVQVSYACYFADSDLFMKLVPAFTKWHNNLLYDKEYKLNNSGLSESAGTLAALLVEINTLENAKHG